MRNIQSPIQNADKADSYLRCRVEIEAALRKLVGAACEMGWSDIKVAMALADASEYYVMELANRTEDLH